MNVLAPREKMSWKDEIKKVYRIFQLPELPLQLKGSASLSSQRYFSDYDFFCNAPLYNEKDFYNIFTDIRNRLEKDPNVYLIETKIEQGKKKYRYYKNEPIKPFSHPDLIKIDIIARIENEFTQVSCLYSFSKTPLTTEEYIKDLEIEMQELKKKGLYYKALKRKFSIYKIEKNYPKLILLTRYFNSGDGLIYQKISNIDAIIQLKEYYHDPETLKRIKINLEQIGVRIRDKDRMYKRINSNAEKLFRIL
jgi:hypothetical protein